MTTLRDCVCLPGKRATRAPWKPIWTVKAARHSVFHHLESAIARPLGRLQCRAIGHKSRPSLAPVLVLDHASTPGLIGQPVFYFLCCVLFFHQKHSRLTMQLLGYPALDSQNRPRGAPPCCIGRQSLAHIGGLPGGQLPPGYITGTTVILYTFFGFYLSSNGLPGTSTCPLRGPDRFSRALNTTTLQVVTSLSLRDDTGGQDI